MEVRIVSLSAWGTQVLLDLELDLWIAGCSHDAFIAKNEINNIPVITTPERDIVSVDKVMHSGPTMTEILLSPWNVKMDLLRKIKPTHIITEGMLNLSGLSSEEAEQILEQDGLRGCRLLDIYSMSINDIFDEIMMMAGVFGYEDRGKVLVRNCRREIEKTLKKYGLKRHTPAVGVLRKWPLLQLAGRWVSDMIEMIGGTPLIYGDDLYIYPDYYFERSPDIIIGGDPWATLPENKEKIKYLDKNKLFSVFTCDKPPSQYVVDGPVFYNRSCTGLITSLKILGEILRNDPKIEERKGIYWDVAG